MRTREQARRGLTIYFAVLIVVSAALEGWSDGDPCRIASSVNPAKRT